MLKKNILFVLIAFSIFPNFIESKTEEGVKGNEKTLGKNLKEKIVKTSHSITFGKSRINYNALTGTLLLKNNEGKTKASVFFISYVKKNNGEYSNRPILFSFNGGPGSSSVWLHLGLLGPKRVFLKKDGSMPPPPYRLVENKFSMLEFTDLVFIDPVSTGFSRAMTTKEEKNFHGVNEDIKSVGDFIRLYLTKFDRWVSPKFLIGESYGTTRAAGLSGYLQGRYGIYLNGIILVSSVLDHQTLNFSYGNDLPYILYLPSYAATAWYHNKTEKKDSRSLENVLMDAEKFASGEYSTALLKGNTLKKNEFDRIAMKLSELTSLSPELIKSLNLRIGDREFFSKLLYGSGQMIGRLDSRFKMFRGVQKFGKSERFFSDPSYSAIQGPYSETFNNYLSKELGFKSEFVYEIMSPRISAWKLGEYEGRYVNVADILGKAIAKNPFLKVFVASGFYDLATPYFATKYTFNHMILSEKLRRNISFGYYKAGHMMYINSKSLVRLRKDLKKFMDSAILQD